MLNSSLFSLFCKKESEIITALRKVTHNELKVAGTSNKVFESELDINFDITINKKDDANENTK